MKKVTFMAILLLSSALAAKNDTPTYVEKCSELIEQSKSIAGSYTTSITEATMAGECLGMLKTMTEIYSCEKKKFKSIKNLPLLIVENDAKTLEDVSKALDCHG